MKIIVATAEDWGIGRDGHLLFKLPDDMKFFRETTMGKVVVMGYETLKSMPNGAPLKGRTNLVMSRKRMLEIDGATVVHSVDELFDKLAAFDTNDVFVIGGTSVYEQLLDYCTHALVTKVAAKADADSHFPNIDARENWHLSTTSEECMNNGISFAWTVYENSKIKMGV